MWVCSHCGATWLVREGVPGLLGELRKSASFAVKVIAFEVPLLIPLVNIALVSDKP